MLWGLRYFAGFICVKYVGMPRLLQGRAELLGVRVLFCKKNKSWKLLDFARFGW